MGAAEKREAEELAIPVRHTDPPDGHFPEESHGDEGEGSWLVSYADMMTLLVGFFVVLQSFSKPDAGEFEKVKKETTKIFGGEYSRPFEDLAKDLQKVVKDMKMSDQVIFSQNDQGLEVTFRGALFFDPGAYELKDQAKVLMDNLIPVIAQKAKDYGIVVEGHTDSTPLSSRGPLFSNWELSSVRACTVLRLFQEKGFSPKKMKALGWGDTHPVVAEKNSQGIVIPEAQAQNRRVVIKILNDFGG